MFTLLVVFFCLFVSDTPTLCPLFLFLQAKKSKKKAKQAVKETKTVTADGKEPEEGDILLIILH